MTNCVLRLLKTNFVCIHKFSGEFFVICGLYVKHMFSSLFSYFICFLPYKSVHCKFIQYCLLLRQTLCCILFFTKTNNFFFNDLFKSETFLNIQIAPFFHFLPNRKVTTVIFFLFFFIQGSTIS